MNVLRSVAFAATILLAALPARGQGSPFLFVEPDLDAEAGELPAFRPVDDPARLARLRAWTSNEAALFAHQVYRMAWLASRADGKARAPETLVIAVEADAASTGQGYRLREGTSWEVWPHAPYLSLSEEANRFSAILLHESGHADLVLLTGGKPLPGRSIASIPHAATALTDRTTAFAEGFAIALEAVLAQRAVAPDLHARFWHGELQFGVMSSMQGEYFRPSAGLAAYAQPSARHQEIRDNLFAFVSAFRGPDYLRAQLDPARDLASLRDANQILQSEGFVASVFYALLMRGAAPDAERLRTRLGALMPALKEVLDRARLEPDTPLLVETVGSLARRVPAERREILATVLDLSRGVLVDPRAGAMWRRHYLAALRQQLDQLELDDINAARRRWLETAQADPTVLASRLGPQVPCVVGEVVVSLPGMDVEAPLGFDLNTAEEGVLRCVPGISDEEVARWLAERERAPFLSAADFRARVSLRPQVTAKLAF